MVHLTAIHRFDCVDSTNPDMPGRGEVPDVIVAKCSHFRILRKQTLIMHTSTVSLEVIQIPECLGFPFLCNRNPEDIFRFFPHLTLSCVRKCLYYFEIQLKRSAREHAFVLLFAWENEKLVDKCLGLYRYDTKSSDDAHGSEIPLTPLFHVRLLRETHIVLT